MAKYNEILSGRFNRFLQKLFSMKGGPPAPQLSGDIQMSLNFFNGVENRWLEGWNRFGVGAFCPGVAAQNSHIRFLNPVTSGVVAVIERLSISEATADTIFISQDTGQANLTNAIGQRCLDNRPVRGSTSTLGAACQTSFLQNVAINGGIIARINVPAFNDVLVLATTDNQEITILPGDSLEVTSTNANVNMIANIIWRERPLEDSEKT